MIFNKKKKKWFVSLATARHNATIEQIAYSNKKITKRLFYIGMFLPDFKISWGVLLVYLFVKYPISLRVRVKCWLRELRVGVRLLVLRRGFN